MRILKKLSFVVMGLAGLIIVLALTLPVIFKDDIQAMIKKGINENINADVVYTPDDISISLFSNFPNLTIHTGSLGVFNRTPFEGKHLFVTDNLAVEVNLLDLIFGDQVKVAGIDLSSPDINIVYLEDGRANFDITYPDTVAVTDEISEPFSFSIERWGVSNGTLAYTDLSMPFSVSLKNISHKGSGNFNENEFDLKTSTTADSLSMSYDGTEYLSDKTAEVNAVISISDNFSRFTFKENVGRLNDFSFGLDGWFLMNEESYDMDLSFSSRDNSFKSLLSLVPGIYSDSFKDLKASGNVSFAAALKGTFSETRVPAFKIDLGVQEGMFQYPGLPQAVRNVHLDMAVNNSDGVIENTSIAMKDFHMELGQNPVDAILLIENLKDYKMDGTLRAKIDLKSVTELFPVDDLTLKGQFSVDASVKGVYDSIRKIIPVMHVDIGIADGYAKSKEYPIAIENLQALALVNNSSGKLDDTTIDLKKISMLVGGELFEAAASLRNPSDLQWNLMAKGGLDIAGILKIFPVEGLEAAGKLKADITSSGKLSDVTLGRYDRLPAGGMISLSGFSMKSADFKLAVSVPEAQLLFSPKNINLTSFKAAVGKSDFSGSGLVSDYMGYVLGKNEALTGNLNINSGQINLNEFMTEEEEPVAEDTTEFGVIPIPENISFRVTGYAKKVLFQNYTLSDVSGEISVRNQTVDLKNLGFKMMGGSFTMNGSYNTKDIKKPGYAFDMKVDALSIREAFRSFSLVKKFAPIAQGASGNISSSFKIDGILDENMSPVASKVNASGILNMENVGVKGSAVLKNIAALIKLPAAEDLVIKDTKASFSIKDGRVAIKPFDVVLGSYRTTVAGTSGLDGSLSYNLTTFVPSASLPSSIAGLMPADPNTKEVPLKISLGGTFGDPKPVLLTSDIKEKAKEAVVQKATEEGRALLTQKLTSALGGKASSADSVKKDSAANTDAVQKLLEDKLKGLLKKKKKN